METMKCKCMRWARTSLMVFGRDGHHPGCQHYEVPTVEQFVEDLFMNFNGEKADRLALVRKDASGDLGGWNRNAIIVRLNKFMELHRKEDESSASRVGRNENPSPKSPKPRVIPHGQGRSS